MLDDAPVVGEAHEVHLLDVECLTGAGEPEGVTGVDGTHARVRGDEIAFGDRLDEPVRTSENVAFRKARRSRAVASPAASPEGWYG